MLDLTKYSALSFDVYGTLIDWEAGISSVLLEWAQRVGCPLDEEGLLLAYSTHEADVEAEYPGLIYSEVLQASFRRMSKELGFPVSVEDVQALGRSVPSWPAFPDSPEALARLKKHYKLIILSNVHNEGVQGSIARLGDVFDQVNTAENIGSYKPNSANFTFLLEHLGDIDVPQDQLLHVAQSLFHDHVPAQKFNLPTVWINRRHDKPGWGATPDPGASVTPTLEFPSLQAFADEVDRAFGS